MLSPNTFNESPEERLKSGLASQFGGATGGLLRNRFAFPSHYILSSVHIHGVRSHRSVAILLSDLFASVILSMNMTKCIKASLQGFDASLSQLYTPPHNSQHLGRCVSSRSSNKLETSGLLPVWSNWVYGVLVECIDFRVHRLEVIVAVPSRPLFLPRPHEMSKCLSQTPLSPIPRTLVF